MKRRFLDILVIGVGALLSAVPAMAHHSFAAEYDRDKPIKVAGVVKKVEWANPHIWIFVDVTDASGKVTTWGFSGGPPGMLARRGISKDALKIGDTISVEGFRAKDGSNNGSGGNVTFADGRSVFAGSNQDVVPGRQ